MTDHDTPDEPKPNEEASAPDQGPSASSGGRPKSVLAIGAVVMLALGGLGGALLADVAQHDEKPTIERAGYADRGMGHGRGMRGDGMKGGWGEGNGGHGYGRGMHGGGMGDRGMGGHGMRGGGMRGGGMYGMASKRGEHQKLMRDLVCTTVKDELKLSSAQIERATKAAATSVAKKHKLTDEHAELMKAHVGMAASMLEKCDK